MGCPERTAPDQTLSPGLPCHRINLAGLYGLLHTHRREYAGKGIGQRALSRTRGSYHYHIMTAGGSYLKSSLRALLAYYFREIDGGEALVRHIPAIAPCQQRTAVQLAGQDVQGLIDIADSVEFDSVQLHRLPGGFGRDYAAPSPAAYRHFHRGQHPRDSPDRAVQSQLSHKYEFGKQRQFHLARSRQYARGYGQVIDRALLRGVGRCQIYHYLAPRDMIAETLERSHYAQQTLPDRGIGQSYQMHSYPLYHIHLHRDKGGIYALASGAEYFSQHKSRRLVRRQICKGKNSKFTNSKISDRICEN